MAETIKSFLISLGYTVDGNTEAKFNRSVEAATKGAATLGVALTAAATAMAAAVTKIAAGFDELHYASQRTNSSIQSMKGLSYAVSQLGGSYQGAMGSIEAFAQKMRSNPGVESLIKSVGVVTRQNGKLRETTDIMQDFAKSLSSKPYYVQLQYMEALGLDEKTYRALQSGELPGLISDYAQKTRELGVDQKKAGDIGVELTRAWGALAATTELIGVKLEQTLGPALARVVKQIDDFLVRNADKIVKFFDEAGKAAAWLGGVFEKLIVAATPVWEQFDQLAMSLTGQSGLQVAMEAFAIWLMGSWLVRILAGFTAVGNGWGLMLLRLGINPVTALAGAMVVASTTEANAGEEEEIARRRAAGTYNPSRFDGDGAVADPRSWRQKNMPTWLGGVTKSQAIAASGTTKAANAEETYRLARAAGLSHAAASGMVASEQHESGFNPTVPGDGGRARGSFQWHPERRAAILKGTGIDVSDVNTSHADQVRGALWEMQSGADAGAGKAWKLLQDPTLTPEQAGAIFSENFERPARRNYEKMSRGATAAKWADRLSTLSNIQNNAAIIGSTGSTGVAAPLASAPAASNSTSLDVSQKTEITILGGSDPAATAAAVSDAQGGVNRNMMRNFQGAVR